MTVYGRNGVSIAGGLNQLPFRRYHLRIGSDVPHVLLRAVSVLKRTQRLLAGIWLVPAATATSAARHGWDRGSPSVAAASAPQ